MNSATRDLTELYRHIARICTDLHIHLDEKEDVAMRRVYAAVCDGSVRRLPPEEVQRWMNALEVIAYRLEEVEGEECAADMEEIEEGRAHKKRRRAR